MGYIRISNKINDIPHKNCQLFFHAAYHCHIRNYTYCFLTYFGSNPCFLLLMCIFYHVSKGGLFNPLIFSYSSSSALIYLYTHYLVTIVKRIGKFHSEVTNVKTMKKLIQTLTVYLVNFVCLILLFSFVLE